MLAACLMAVWSCAIATATSGAKSLSFRDDRYVWSDRASALLDEAFRFSCDKVKSAVGRVASSSEGIAV